MNYVKISLVALLSIGAGSSCYAGAIRMVTLKDRDIACIKKANELATESKSEAPLLLKHLSLIDEGKKDISRDEWIAVMNQAYEYLLREDDSSL